MLLLAQAAGLFTAPALAAVGAAAIAIPVIIHLMSRFRRRPEPWGAMRFLLEAYKKQRKRLQIERLLLLLVRCLVVLLAGLALAGPVLSGCTQGGGLASLFSGSAQGRVVYIVVDDALSTQTRAAGGTRLDGLKDEALTVVDELGDGDRAVVIRAGRPPVWVTDEPTADRAALRDAIEGIDPRYGRSDVSSALLQVESSLDELNVRDGNAVVVVLSDFSRSAAYLDEQLPPELAGLGGRASVVTSLPAQGTDNVQVVSVTPRRRMVVATTGGPGASSGGGGGTVSTEVRLRRFGGETQARSVGLEVALLDDAGEEVASATRTARWLAGQREALVNLDLPAGLDGGETRGGRELVVVARLVADNESAGVDALPADDRASAVVTLRERLQVALVDDGSVVNEQPGALQPWHYMRAVLAPSGASGGAFEVSPMLPTAVSDGALSVVDAAVVLRPDQLTASGWEALQTFAQRGGLVWVWVPATVADESAAWPETMTRVFALPWRVMGEVSVVDAQVSPGGSPVDATTRAPAVLQYLAADWREKLGWVSVSRRLGLDAPEEDRWIVMDTADAALPDADAPVLMAGRAVGSGALLFTATAPDARFTNLVVRPLFSPLVHDSLRGVLGDAGRLPPVVSGDAPDLGRGWRNAGQLDVVSALDHLLLPDEPVEKIAPEPTVVRTDGDVAQVISAIDRPGVYRGGGAASERLLAVNADASAGDTHPAQPRLEQWLDKVGGAGGWSYLEDKRREQGGALASASGAEDLTWPLLWVVLGLVVLEMFLARWFSHAADHERPTVVGRALSAWSGEDAETPKNTGDSAERGRAA